MHDLGELTCGYLESSGFTIVDKSESLVIADRPFVGSDRDTWVVWPIAPGEDTSFIEPQLGPQVRKVLLNYPDAKGFIVTTGAPAFSKDFTADLRDSFGQRINYRAAVEFFDAEFKFERARSALSAIQELRSADASAHRVPQPYSIDDARPERSADLFPHLLSVVSKADRPSVHIVVGRAGIGKSVLFQALFSELYERFIESKAARKVSRRPIPLLPAHRRDAFGLRTELIVESFLNTEVASPIKRNLFEWLLVNGFMVWLLDGLDELYAGDPTFFDYLLDLITRKGSRAQIVVCCRDSLLTTCDAFAEFREWCAGDATSVQVYRLEPWDRGSKRLLAYLALEKRRPHSGDRESESVAAFMQRVDESPSLKAVSDLPYYCRLLIDLHERGELRQFDNDLELVDFAVERMIAREQEKGILDLGLFVPHGLQDWLQDIAAEYVESGMVGVSRDQASLYGQLVLRDDVHEQRRADALTTLLQFPLFTEGSAGQSVRFAHDLIAESLAARAYLRALARQAANVGHRLGALPNPTDSTLLRHMAARIGPNEEAAIRVSLVSGEATDRGFRNLLALIMHARPQRDLLRKLSASIEGRDLSDLVFENRDLGGFSFRNANLSRTRFRNCDLRRAMFEGAILQETRFEEGNQLDNAEFGDLTRVRSLYEGRRRLETHEQITDWLERVTGVPARREEPCPAALQLRHLFGKYVKPLGEPRRDELKYDALLAGKRFEGAPSTEECVKSACRRGFLVGPDFRDRYRRAEGDRYAEMVRLVRDARISEEIGKLLAETCRRRGCVHQLA